jgi:terminase large subunit-like protein
MIEIDRALADVRMLGAGLSSRETWQTWLIALKAAFALPLTEEEREIFRDIAGERGLPKHRVRELWCVAGRRSGKSRMAAAVAIFLALFQKHRLSPGERGMCLVIAGSVDQARTVFNYVRGFLEAAPALALEVVAVRRQEVELRNGLVIAVHSNSFRTVRGRTLVAAIFDEVSFWRDDTTATPDIETYRAVLPSLATTDGMLVGISTPYRKLGLLHQKWRDHFGVDDDNVLVVQGGSTVFNPTLSDATIAAQRAADPTAAGAEWDAQFRSDIGAFLDDELIDAAIDHGRPLELPPVDGVVYRAFTDASGGAVGGDAYALGIGHREGEIEILDVVRGIAGKFDPQQVTKEYAALCTAYRVHTVVGDAYGREWVAAAWGGVGKEYTRSQRPKGELYVESLPLFTRGLVRLPNHARLIRELRLLERRTYRSGKDTVEHPRNGHDDYANVVCGVLNLLRSASVPEFKPTLPFVAGRPRDIPGGSVFSGAGSYQGPSNEPWRDYVNPDGSIRSTPRSRWDF